MTPTERVRAKLDTHGVEWEAYGQRITAVITREGNTAFITTNEESDCCTIYNLTPEQAGKIGVFLA